jgi:2-polyprenyl-3-methyl-5-hydroxy-6-metoxy-1,4-benzoquinol methylase
VTATASASSHRAEVVCKSCEARIAVHSSDLVSPVACVGCGRRYEWQEGILMLGEPRDPDGYPEDVHALLAEVEPRHFWFRERNRLIVSTLREVFGDLNGRAVLDIGCGTGFVLSALEAAGCSGWGLDMNQAGLRYARRRLSGPLVCEDAARVPFVEQFPIVLLCDVIEHVQDDLGVLRQARNALRSDGAIVVTVPAHRWLWTPVDDASGHRRRYSRQMLVQALADAGFETVVARYFNALLLPIQIMQRRLLGGRPVETLDERLHLIRRALRVPPGPVNVILGAAMSTDLILSRLPKTFGSSIIAVARPA